MKIKRKAKYVVKMSHEEMKVILTMLGLICGNDPKGVNTQEMYETLSGELNDECFEVKETSKIEFRKQK